jgi:hypothetical protein
MAASARSLRAFDLPRDPAAQTYALDRRAQSRLAVQLRFSAQVR